ncbi:MAG: pitrilysin family protein [Rhodocyclaceae bacterium]|nr:pitrilysin family protein [Rhodocyclaceae bacterium]
MKKPFSCRSRMLLPALFAVLSASPVAPALAAAEPITFEKTLGNGLKVIVREDHRAPTVAHMVWYRVGAMDELTGTSGVAHVLEHMMFKGTATIGPGEFNKRVADAGGRDNAFTNLDYTAYFQQVPKDKLPDMMALEADRMANLKLAPAEFAKEIQVVMEERRMRTDDNPHSRVREALMAVAFQAHPYRRPVIGWMPDLEHMTAQDAQDWYHRWYAPNNACLVVVGDVDKDQVFALAQKTYGAVKAHEAIARKTLGEPVQDGLRRVTVKAPAELPYVALVWKVPKLENVAKDREPYALEVLAGILDGSDAARFSRNLVRGSRLAVSAGAGYDPTQRGPALFMLDGVPSEGHTAAELEAALRAEVARIAKDGVAPEELARVKTQVVAGQIYKRDSMFGQAMEMGVTETVGFSWRDLDPMVEQVRSVTAEEVQAVARKYFGDDSLSVGTLDPQPLSGKPRLAPVGGHRH